MFVDFTNPLIYGVPCFLGLILVELAYSKHHKKSEKKVLYNWKDFAASMTMGFGSAILAPLTKTIVAIVLFNFVYELFNPLVGGIRMNIMGYKSFGYAWYVWLLC